MLGLRMSRAHEGHSLSSFFRKPFRIIVRKRALSFSGKFNQTLKSFEVGLAERLKGLQAKKTEGFRDLSWMQEGMEALCATNEDLRAFIAELRFPLTKWDEKWMDEYLDDTVKLLDICIVLNARISRLEQIQLLVQYVSHLLDSSKGVLPHDKLFDALAELKEVEKAMENEYGTELQRISRTKRCAIILQGMRKGSRLGKLKVSAKGKVLLRAINGLKAITVFVCSICACVLFGCSTADFLVELRVPEHLLWSAAFMSLQMEMNDEIRSGGPLVLNELESLDAAVKNVSSMIQILLDAEQGFQQIRFTQGVQELQHSATSLSQGLDCLTKRINEFFQIVLNGRNALLDGLRLSQGDDILGKDEPT